MSDDLTTAREALRIASSDTSATDDLRTFLEVVTKICRDPAAAASPEFRQFIRDTSPLIDEARVPLGKHIRETERFIAQEFHGDEWYGVAERRSEIEFVRTLYNGLSNSSHSAFTDVENLDHILKQKGDQEGPVASERIPTVTPSSHWWWWYPKLPPGE
jgi:hypothetical protein